VGRRLARALAGGARARWRLLRLDAGRLAFDRLFARLALLAAHRVQQQARTDRTGHGDRRVAAHELRRHATAGLERTERGAGFDPLDGAIGDAIAQGVADAAGQLQRAAGDRFESAHGATW